MDELSFQLRIDKSGKLYYNFISYNHTDDSGDAGTLWEVERAAFLRDPEFREFGASPKRCRHCNLGAVVNDATEQSQGSPAGRRLCVRRRAVCSFLGKAHIGVEEEPGYLHMYRDVLLRSMEVSCIVGQSELQFSQGGTVTKEILFGGCFPVRKRFSLCSPK